MMCSRLREAAMKATGSSPLSLSISSYYLGLNNESPVRAEFYGSGAGCVRRRSDPRLRSAVSHPCLHSSLFSGPIRQKGLEVLFASIGQCSPRKCMPKSPGVSNPNTLRRSSPCVSAISFFPFSLSASA